MALAVAYTTQYHGIERNLGLTPPVERTSRFQRSFWNQRLMLKTLQLKGSESGINLALENEQDYQLSWRTPISCTGFFS